MSAKAQPSVIRIVGQNKGGGARVHFFQLNTELVRNGQHPVTFIPAPSFADPVTHRELVGLDYRHTMGFGAILCEAHSQSRPLYIHSHLRNATIKGALLASMLSVSHVVTVHGPLYEGKGAPRDHLIARAFGLALRRARLVIFISAFVRDHVLQQAHVGRSQIASTVIYNGSDDLGLAPPAPSDAPLRVVVVGELTHRKGMEDLLGLIDLLQEGDLPNLTIDVFGRGPYENALRARASGRVNLNVRGYEKHVAAIFHNSDVHLILSRTEGFGRVLTEAMSAGVPTLAYRAGAFPEIVTSGVDGILTESLSEIARTLRELAADRSRLAPLREAARTTYKRRFTTRHFARATIKAIDQAIDR